MSAGNNNSQVEVRMADVAAAPAISTVLKEAFEEYRPLYTEEAFAATTPTARRVESRMQEGPVWVATHDGAVVGTVAAVPRGHDLYVRGMGVLPTARGLGIGERMLEEVQSAALAAGHRRLILSTTPFLARAIRLYERFGFARSDEGPRELFGTPLFSMTKELEPLGNERTSQG